jgi:DNA-binding transcriptional LysR family regulator
MPEKSRTIAFGYWNLRSPYNLDYMQLHQLTYFVTVADTRHFTHAAERLGVAQPSLSQQVRALERALGSDLFVRARGNIGLTAAGEALLPYARRILAEVESAEQEIAELQQLRRGRVRLGATPSVCTGLLPEVVRDFRAHYPAIRLELEESASHNLIERMGEGLVDLALLMLPLPAEGPSLVTIPLLEEDLVLASGPQGCAPAAHGEQIEIEALRHVPLVMFRRGYEVRDITVNACRRAGFEPDLAIQGGELDAVLSLVEAGVGSAVLPSMVANRRAFTVNPFAPPGLSRVIALAHRRDAEPPRATRALLTTLREHLDRLAATDALPPGTRPAIG